MKTILILLFAAVNCYSADLNNGKEYSVNQVINADLTVTGSITGGSGGSFVMKSGGSPGGVMSGPLTTSSLTVTGARGLQVGLYAGLQDSASTTDLTNNLYYSSGWKYRNTAAAGVMEQYLGEFFFYTAPSGSANAAASLTERMKIANTGAVTIPGSSFSVGGSTLVVSGGKVGIGTAAPTSKLSVEEKTWIDGYASGVYAENKSGNALSSGTAVIQFVGDGGVTPISITTTPANGSFAVGTIYDASCAATAGTKCRVCTEGICPAKLASDQACAITNFAVITGAEVGRVACVASPDGATNHWQELGQPASYTAVNGDTILIWAHRN